MNRKRSVSMKDVAALAQVSVGTVSNVLNSPERVSEATRSRVEDAIAKLGWVRNESARQLRAGRSRAIGIVVLDVANPFFTDVIRGAESFLYAQGFSVHIGNSDQRLDREAMLLEHFEEQRVRGALVAPIGDSVEHIVRLKARGIPIVLVDRVGSMADLCSVAVDDIEGGRLAMNHLVDTGHRRVAFVGGPTSLSQVRDRRRGAEFALAGQGQLIVVETPAMDVQSGVRAAADVASLSAEERPTAVFAANDLLAIGLLQGFVAAGLRVPEDIAIIGYDDIDFAAAAAVPLSSIRQPRAALGEKAAELLLAEIAALEAGESHRHEAVRFVPELIVRRSTAMNP